MRLFLIFFLFVSFWPWEKDPEGVKKSSFALSQPPALLKTLRVALFYEKSEVRINVPAPYEIESVPAHESLEKGAALSSVSVRPGPEGIRVGPNLYRASGIRVEAKTGELQIENRTYRNAIQVLKNPKGTLTVVNEVDVEDYLGGVLPSEMIPTWPEEALKAQAVISRTYAVFKNIENQNFPFTLSADVASQVYNGKSAEKPATNRAVEKTRGEILVHQGKIFPTFFHSTCGGRTTRADYQWKIEPHPSLKGVECPYCRASKYYSWKATFSASEIQRRLRKKGFLVSGIQDIRAEKIDASGRPRIFVIRHSGGTLEIPANDFRVALGPDQMRSTLIQVARSDDGEFIFKGKGWGHGVGLCQYGAKQLAELGYDYADILRYYYPDSEIRNLEQYHTLAAGSDGPVPAEEAQGTGIKGLFHKVKNYFEEY